MIVKTHPLANLDSPSIKIYQDGTHRLISPEETLARVKPFIPIFGITRIANITGLDSIGIPVTVVCRPNSRSLSVSQGKGLSLISAKVSGLMESVESYHAENISLPLKLCTHEEIRYTHRVVNTANLPRITHSRFHSNYRILWIEGYDLLNNELVWLPYELIHTNYTVPFPNGSGCFPLTSNGLASGNHLLEAISHGICEVVERDATALWTLLDKSEQNQTRLDLKTVDDPDCIQVLSKYEQAKIEVAVWDTTTEIGLPSFLCTIIERTDDPLRLLYASSGMGCHSTRRIALLRALTEAAQSRLTYIAGSRDDKLLSI